MNLSPPLHSAEEEKPRAATRTRGPLWGSLPLSSAADLGRDLPIIIAALALFYGLLALTHYWNAPAGTQEAIQLNPGVLPRYALFSLARIITAYLISLGFAIVYGQIAAHNRHAERIMIPLLDTLQSIPVLSFLPPVMVAMVALFPTRQFGVELGSILLIFTGQVWNMAFSVYSSTKNIAYELQEAAQIYRLSWWQRFTRLELPSAAIGLVWNSMMSVAGGWFFLMACEAFTLGKRDLRLPGLGSYLQTAAANGDTRSIVWGVTAMVAVIVLLDQLVWRPVIAWAEKFKLEQVESTQAPRSPILTLLRRSRLLDAVSRRTTEPAREKIDLYFARKRAEPPGSVQSSAVRQWLTRTLMAVVLLGILYAVASMASELRTLTTAEILEILHGAGATFLRVLLALALAGLWTIPVGVHIGLRPRLAAIAQPIAQVAASVPATALFPIVLLALIRVGGGLGIGSIVLLLLGTQWYILFNVIAGASSIPTDLKEVCTVYRLGRLERWRKLLLPGIFPYLITGFVTASGGAWNASIVAEYSKIQNRTYSTIGLGAVISRATDSGNTGELLGATVVMALLVVVVNRLFWRRMYGLAATRFKLES
jgi:NitT/TauT family transport system permease protein